MSYPLFEVEALIFYFASLMLSTATIILGGIPAAIYERLAGIEGNSTPTSLWIWLAGTGVLTIPAHRRLSEASASELKLGLVPVCRAVVGLRCVGVVFLRLPGGSLPPHRAQPSGAEGPRHGTHAPRRVRDRAARLRLRLARDLLRHDRHVVHAATRVPGRRLSDAR